MHLSSDDDDAFVPRNELRSPLEIVNQMDWVLRMAKRGTRVINQATAQYLEAKHAYQLAYKHSKLAATGTVGDREDSAQRDNWEKFVAMEIAELALKHAKEKRRDLEDELSKLQTEAGLVRTELNLAR